MRSSVVCSDSYHVNILQIYAVASSAAVLGKLAIVEDTIVVLKTFDELRNDLSVSAGFIAEDVTTFISGSTVPLIQEFSQVMTHDFCFPSALTFSSPRVLSVMTPLRTDSRSHYITHSVRLSIFCASIAHPFLTN